MATHCSIPEGDEAVREAVDALLETRGVADLVAAYFNPTRHFAGDTFRGLLPNEPHRIGAADLLAVQLLVAVPPLAVRQLLASADEVEPLLKAIPTDLRLWDATDEELERVEEALDRLDNCFGVGPVIAGKLLARKRPLLVPIIDKVVLEVLCLPAGRNWTSLRAVLQDADLQNRINELQPAGVPVQPTIRLLDVAAWMRGSKGASAREVRRRLGILDD